MTDSEFNEFKKHNWKCFEKFDGTKLSLIRNSESFNKDDYTKNWIVAYKGNIIYPFEFKTVDEKSIFYDSIGCSQYKLFFNELKTPALHGFKYGSPSKRFSNRFLYA